MARFFRDGARVPSLAGHGHGCLSVALVGVQVLVAFWLASTILHSWSLHVPVAPRATGYAARLPVILKVDEVFVSGRGLGTRCACLHRSSVDRGAAASRCLLAAGFTYPRADVSAMRRPLPPAGGPVAGTSYPASVAAKRRTTGQWVTGRTKGRGHRLNLPRAHGPLW